MNDNDDLRDIFRRAFEEREGRTPPPSGGSGQPPRRPTVPTLPPDWWRSRRLWIGGIALLLFLSFNWIVSTYTEWLWFTNVAYTDIWVKTFLAKLLTFLIFFVLAFIILFFNARIATRGALATSSGFSPASYGGFRAFLVMGSLAIAFLFASAASSSWETWLRFLYQADSPVVDPIYSRSLSFYFFTLPIVKFMQGWLIPLLFFALIGVVGIYAVHNVETLRQGNWKPQDLVPLRRHVALIGGTLAILLALGQWINRYDLLYEFSTSDLVAGAGYTDLRVTAPVLILNATLLLLLAGAFFYNFVRFNLRPLIAIAVLWVLASVLLSGILPGVIERFVVAPNRLGRERPYLVHTINSTREAFGLSDVDEREFGEVTPLTAQDLEDNAEALTNIRLWDYRVLPDNYRELQALRTYYQFSDVDIDRYVIDGVNRQVMLSARELNKSALTNRDWQNLKLEFTHGYGIVMNPVDRFTRDGQPEFFISDIPPVIEDEVDIELTRPEIYYGEQTTQDDIVYVGTSREFNYPAGEQNVRTPYAGKGGVQLNSYLRKLAFALRFADINVMINDDIDNNTRVMFHRQISDRVKKITPFLLLDQDPYIVVADGRLVWMFDSYTVSGAYPYSEPALLEKAGLPRNINYIRNAAKITVDAYDGTITYYRVDMDDPITETYANAFPDLFRPISEMPQSLQDHIRYPETLFLIQTHQYLKYHMTDVDVFFNQEDLWAIPQEEFENNRAQDIEPYYVIFNLPGEEETEYLLIQPFTPNNKPNMVAWIAARNDAENYGELVAYSLPKQQVVLGPIQIEATIGQNSEISPQISLWNEGGSIVTRGNLIVIPLNQSFLYVEPLYLRSEGSGSRPELKRVIVASGDRVVMSETLGEALATLLDEPALAEGTNNSIQLGGGETLPLPDDFDGAVQALIQSANAQMQVADDALQAGDWTTYGQAQDQLRNDLQQLFDLTGGDGQ